MKTDHIALCQNYNCLQWAKSRARANKYQFCIVYVIFSNIFFFIISCQKFITNLEPPQSLSNNLKVVKFSNEKLKTIGKLITWKLVHIIFHLIQSANSPFDHSIKIQKSTHILIWAAKSGDYINKKQKKKSFNPKSNCLLWKYYFISLIE